MSAMLEPILASVRRRLPRVLAAEASYRATAAAMAPARDFGGALSAGGLQVIAELKRRSPSAGSLSAELDPAAAAVAYRDGGAASISVLTEPDHFAGSIDDLVTVREAVALPLLRKDFIVAPAQVWQARSAGADAVLLIVAALTDDDLAALVAVCEEAGLAALVEAHTATEAKRAVAAGATIVGINNRDLKTFATNLATAEDIAPMIADVPVRVAESGISDAGGATRMAEAGYHAVLVGEALVRAADPGMLLAELRAACSRGAP